MVSRAAIGKSTGHICGQRVSPRPSDAWTIIAAIRLCPTPRARMGNCALQNLVSNEQGFRHGLTMPATRRRSQVSTNGVFVFNLSRLVPPPLDHGPVTVLSSSGLFMVHSPLD